MFYSHQLLSKKHPMGQIWIAATYRANINRTKAAKINIAQICKQILNPPVPLALRLSGILMGGIVQIYKRKLYFLYEDMNAFLMKIKVEAARNDEDRTKLPKRKYRAKYENITMASGDITGADVIERDMREPSVPLFEGGNNMEEMFFNFPDVVENLGENSSPQNLFQAAVEDITLLEHDPYSPHQRKSGSSLSANSILGPLDDCLPEFHLSGPRTSPEVGPVEDMLPDILPDIPSPDLAGALHPILEEQLPQPETIQKNVILPVAGGSQTKRQVIRSSRSTTRKRKFRMHLYDDETEICKKTFAAWLQDTSDIVGRKCVTKVPGKVKEINKQLAIAVQANLNLPSVCVSVNMKYRPEPTWAPELQEMWQRLVIKTPSKPTDSRKIGDTTILSPTTSGSKHNSPMEMDFPIGGEVPVPQETDFPVEADNPVPQEIDFPVEAENPIPQETDFPIDMDLPVEAAVNIDQLDLPQSPRESDHHSLGSVEKLRAALQTPSTGSREDIFGNKFGLRTPALFAPLTTDGKSSKRSMSASYGGSFSYDSEGEPPTSGKSRRRITDSSGRDVGRSMSPISGELPELNFQPPRAYGKADMIDYFSSGDFQAGILAQSQLVEDTSGSSQPVPADSINPTTIFVAKFLREKFNKLNEKDVYEASTNELTAGLDRTHAAKMFYQICVLASNESITVHQAEPYGDILLKRSMTL